MKKTVKLQPVLKSYIWGGNKLEKLFGRRNQSGCVAESWEVSVHRDGVSLCDDGKPFTDFLNENPCSVDKNGGNFPLLVKYIDAKQNLSVQVHPTDDYAQKHENDNGKTEMWYIVQADDDAGIYCGFKKTTDKTEFLKKLADGTVADLLNYIPVKKGDCFLIEAGTVHAICKGCVVCEVQQNSNVTYRVYDYDRVDSNGNKRQLHIEQALNVINFNAYKDVTGSEQFKKVNGGQIRKLTSCKYFSCFELLLDGEYRLSNDESFVAVNVLSGKCVVNGISTSCGDSIFVACGEKINIFGKANIILTTK